MDGSLSEFFERLHIETSRILFPVEGWLETFPLMSKCPAPFSTLVSVILQTNFVNILRLVKLFLVFFHFSILDLLIESFRDALGLQQGSINCSVGLMHFPNLVIHFRLCELRLVHFVMAVLSIADQIDKDVLLEFLPVLDTQFDYSVHFLNVL